MPWRQEAM